MAPWLSRAIVPLATLGALAACVSPRAPSATATAAASSGAAQPALACVLQAPEHVSLTEPVVPVTFTLQNRADTAARILARHTPLEGMLGDMFAVARAGQPLEYRGRMVKRGPPEPSEYLELAPGDHVRATIDLLEGYDLTQAGSYTVRFTGGEGQACNEILIRRD